MTPQSGSGEASPGRETTPDQVGSGASGKAETPAQLTKASWFYIVRRTVREFGRDQCQDLAAALTYRATLSLLPALLAIVSLLGVIGEAEETTNTVLGMLSGIGPKSTIDLLRGPILSLAHVQTAGVVLLVAVLGALWTASGYVATFGRALNRIYDREEGRPFWKLRPALLLVTLIVVILIAVTGLLLTVSGPIARSLGDALGVGGGAVVAWNIAKWPILAVVVILIVALLYHSTPNVKQPKFRWVSIGAVLAIVTWVVASAGFAFYVANFASYNRIYGSLGGIIVFLLWLWITNMALLFGAEFDAEMERGRELQAGIAAEVSVQLPLRDDTMIRKRLERDSRERERARALRAGATSTGGIDIESPGAASPGQGP